jgi:hypothetical protein
MNVKRLIFTIAIIVPLLFLINPDVQTGRAFGEVTATNSEIHYPNSDHKIGLWREGVPGADVDNFRFNEIDDLAPGNDGEATYIITNGIKTYAAGITAPTVPEFATNIAVSIVWTGRHEVLDTFHATWPRLTVNSVYFIGPRHVLGTSYETYTDTWLTNPATGLLWTPETANQVNGLAFDTNLYTAVRITQAYVKIDYDIGSVARVDVEKFVWDGASWLDADEMPGPYLLPGNDVQFKFTVANTGNVDLSNVDLTDTIYGDIALDGALAAGASADYFIAGSWAAGQHTNTATVSADYDGVSYTDSDDANYFGDTPLPGLTLVKTASPSSYGSVGDIINYTYLLNNSGDFSLDGPFTVTDDKTSVTCPEVPAGLAAGESIVCTATYSIVLSDLGAGSVTNTAQAHAYYAGAPFDSNVDDETVVANDGQLGKATTTCANMRDHLIAGTALEQTQVIYSGSETITLISGLTNYWTRFDQLSGNVFNFAIQQTSVSQYGFSKYLGVRQLPADNVRLYDSACRLVAGTVTAIQGGTINDATFSFTFNANSSLTGGPYFLQVRYDHAQLLNQVIGPYYPNPGQTLVHYDFATLLEGVIVAQDSASSFSGGYGGVNLNRR